MSTSFSETKRIYLDTQQAADFIGLKKSTMDTWRSSGRYPELPYVKVGGRVKYRMSDLEEWLESRTVSAD